MKMNLKIAVALCLLLSCRLCYSQDKFAVGLRFLPSATTFRYNTGVPILDFLKTAPYDFRIRTTQGIGLTYNPVRKLSVGADLLYSLQGGGYEQRKTNLDYLKIPLWLGYNSSPERKLIFTVQTGIEFSYLIRAKVKYADNKTTNIDQYINKVSIGIPLAVGVRFKMFHSYHVSTQLYLSTDIQSISKTNKAFSVYNYVFPGIRISVDRHFNRITK
nr:outer membrane beta-barrel protein [uncultured Dyadobacter sp.]